MDTLDRAAAIILREIEMGGASMMQLRNARSIADVLSVKIGRLGLELSTRFQVDGVGAGFPGHR